MDIIITPKKLHGTVKVPPSKSIAHRMIIAAALSNGESKISNLSPSIDIISTIECMKALGAEIKYNDGIAVIKGIDNVPNNAILDCHESGSTFRFLIPVAGALGVHCEFYGSGKLPQRPITPFLEELPKHGISFDFSKVKNSSTLPCSISGKLTSGRFYIDGGISSQFITGLMFALPLLSENSDIIITSKLQSKPYIDITVGVLKNFGVEITETKHGYSICGNQKFLPFSTSVEGDYSQSAFFYTANSLGSDLEILGLNEHSFQGDRAIVEICSTNGFKKEPFEIDCSDIPDLVPILAVLGCFCNGTSKIINAARLRLKECDRLAAMEDCLNRIGGKISSGNDFLEIEGVESFTGGEINSYNDHRIAMSMAIASTMCKEPLIIHGAECVSKSYPDFFNVFKELGGEFKIL